MAMADRPPKLLVNASAVGFYGDRPGVRLTEDSGRGAGFLADLTVDWEGAAAAAPAATRVATIRTGLVVASNGALRPLALLGRFGMGGPIGQGGQYWPWISLRDEIRAIGHIVEGGMAGPVNLAGPAPATADEVLTALMTRLHRPYRLRLGARTLGMLLGDAGRELLLASQEVVPARLRADGFEFREATAAAAVASAFSGA
jgi:uncharacterized protein (TIGR01777 family)